MKAEPVANGKDNGATQWKSYLASYPRVRALRFRTDKDFAIAAEILWSDSLRDIPYDLVGNRTIILPAEAVGYFRSLKFTNTQVLTPLDLPPKELAELRKEQGPY